MGTSLACDCWWTLGPTLLWSMRLSYSCSALWFQFKLPSLFHLIHRVFRFKPLSERSWLCLCALPMLLWQQGKTALDYARQSGHKDIVALLEGHVHLLAAQQHIKPALRAPATQVVQAELEPQGEGFVDASNFLLLDQPSDALADEHTTDGTEHTRAETEAVGLGLLEARDTWPTEHSRQDVEPTPVMNLALMDADFELTD
eukprot:m.421548 g.421548  ORF g.421548 m.421548 type:complete len:201 (-) comp56647_c0_seq9:72-674(-)